MISDELGCGMKLQCNELSDCGGMCHEGTEVTKKNLSEM
jgi:hypothetical protein